MSEHGTTKDQVSLEDLKRAIERVHSIRMRGIIHSTELSNVQLEAWRTAFDWRETHTKRAAAALVSEDAIDIWMAERDEGMALIREKLR